MNKRLVLAVMFPIVVLCGLMSYQYWVITFGERYELKIKPYDPRSLLSGHYVTYGVDYNTPRPCRSGDKLVCLKPKRFFSKNRSKWCKRFIRGQCKNGRFVAGIERYYLPEVPAKKLPELMKTGSIVVRVDSNGQARVTKLLFSGQDWKTIKLE